MTRLALLMLSLIAVVGPAASQTGELRFCLRSEPKTFDPYLVDDESSDTLRYLTAGVLIRLNRLTQKLEPELAVSWRVMDAGKRITFNLRKGVTFSDGTSFTAEDVAYGVRRMMDPQLHSPLGDSFRSGDGIVQVSVASPDRLTLTFPAPLANIEALFDQVAIVSMRSPKAVLGPYVIREHKPGASIVLERNSRYWKRDDHGRQLPYVDSLRLDIQQNRELEFLRFRRGQIDLINGLDAELYQRLASEAPASARDSGAGLDAELLWFNQASSSPLPAHKKLWFRSTDFRRAIAESINRDDLCRLAYRGHAKPAAGPVSPANRFWFNSSLKPYTFDPDAALRRLQRAGFRLDRGVLRDRDGHAVEFSLVTNAGNKTRERMAALIQQDLVRIGVKVTITTLDMPSLLERMNRSFDYDACLLGFVNIGLDPSEQMNVWLSSASNHQWNPRQKSPETPWEAEIDRLMQSQAASADRDKRKKLFDRVQSIAWEQAPFIYLVHKNVLSAVSPSVRNAAPGVLRPQTFWNVERLAVTVDMSRAQP